MRRAHGWAGGGVRPLPGLRLYVPTPALISTDERQDRGHPGRGLNHGVHRFFDTAHGDHHLRPWDGLHINGGFDTIPVAILLALLSFLAPLPTAPVFMATVLVSYVAEEWVHYSVHFHQFRWRYFVYIRKHHLYHHSGRGSTVAFALSSGIWDGPLGTPVPTARRDARVPPDEATKNVSPGPAELK